jgi:aminopeptidase
MNTKDMQDYAHLVLDSLSLQPDQSLLIKAEPAHWPFVSVLAEIAYSRGARYVHVRAEHADLYRARVENSKPEYLGHIPAWHDLENRTMIDERWALVSIKSPDDPDALSGLDATRHGIVQQSLLSANAEFRRATQASKLRWIVVAYPTPKWAAKVLGRDADQGATDALWSAMKSILRLDADDPLSAWKEQTRQLKQRQAQLNALELSSVHFVGPGTDLRVGLSEFSRWIGGGDVAEDGITFLPNLPTEEVFTTPDCRQTEGRVCFTRPVQILGTIVDGGWLEFADGRVVDSGAERGSEMLERYLDLDPRARYLGELALVDTASPIYKSGLVFYNTLFDENAACHIALGSSYPKCMAGGDGMTDEEYDAAGGNRSTVHTDVMISSPEVDVIGTRRDGATVDIITAGSFVI